MKLIKGWKKISNEGGFVNETTGQTLIVSKKNSVKTTMSFSSLASRPTKKKAKKSHLIFAPRLKLKPSPSIGWGSTQTEQVNPA